MKHKVHQVQRKQIDSHKVCSKCPPLARTQARKHVGHWSTGHQRLLHTAPHSHAVDAVTAHRCHERRSHTHVVE